MEEAKITEGESMQIIRQMIQSAKEDHRENGDGWLIWGWLLFIASVASAIMYATTAARYISFVWFGILIVGLIINYTYHLRTRGKVKVKTYVHELVEKFGTGFFITLFALIGASYLYQRNNPGSADPHFAFGYYYLLYAFWMFIHGSAIRFRPLIVGAVVNWVAAILIFIITDFRYDMIISAAAILIGYLVPGYMLRNKYRKTLQQ